jgi:DNA-binding MarR family transcriptional regulator
MVESKGDRFVTEGDRSGPAAAPAPSVSTAPERAAALLEDITVLAVRHLSGREISFTTATTLSRLARGGPLRLTRLAADEGVAQPSMSQLVGRLAEQGLVRRVRDPKDGRVVLVGITEAGRRVLERRRAARLARLRKLIATLSDDDQHALAEAARIALPAVRHLTERAALDRADRTPGDDPHAPGPESEPEPGPESEPESESGREPATSENAPPTRPSTNHAEPS